MEMGKLTAKLRDAVPVCLLVEGKEIKRYKNIEIPDDLKKLEYIDFKLDVPLNGTITFKIIFEPGVLPEEFPQTRERRTRSSKEALAPVVNEAPTALPTEEVAEVMQETTDIITFQADPAEEVPEARIASEKATSATEVQAGEEVQPEAITEPEAQEVTPATKDAAKYQKAPTKGRKKQA